MLHCYSATRLITVLSGCALVYDKLLKRQENRPNNTIIVYYQK